MKVLDLPNLTMNLTSDCNVVMSPNTAEKQFIKTIQQGGDIFPKA